MTFRRIASFKTSSDFRAYLQQSNIALDFDDELITGADAPLALPYRLPNGFVVGNRFCVLPMEGWDGTPDGCPSELTFRRWQHFGASGAKLIWGGEAVAVRHDGRANPNQLTISEANLGALASLRAGLVAAHAQSFGDTRDLLIGLQLTHSGRFCRPNDKKRLEPRILYHHPVLDRKFGVPPDYPIMTDDEIKRLIDDFVIAAQRAQRAGFAFVDIKHCHSYLGHEFLSAVDRPGDYGGSFQNRTRFLREIVAGIRANVPGLEIGVRLSAFDFIAFRSGANGVGEPEPFDGARYRYAFGGDGTGVGIDLTEPKKFLDLLAADDIKMVCITGGSPYYNPHLMRPATFPPSDGYQPPEDPLVGVARMVNVTAELKKHRPDLMVVGSAQSYLQEFAPNVAQRVVRTGGADFAGLGRMMLAYPEMIADVLAGRPLQRKRICRTFSDCTTAPRNGMVSGCYPLDEFYKQRPEAKELDAFKHHGKG
ncbi:MAG: NADH:flavin oxidoreductase [Chloroflexi bacterium]|nr:NADH:flavin oxidoreductase [Chloroflexota bacterium]